MNTITIDDFEEVYNSEVKAKGTNAHIPASLKHAGKKVKVIILKE